VDDAVAFVSGRPARAHDVVSVSLVSALVFVAPTGDRRMNAVAGAADTDHVSVVELTRSER
jgi:hypothetical protein